MEILDFAEIQLNNNKKIQMSSDHVMSLLNSNCSEQKIENRKPDWGKKMKSCLNLEQRILHWNSLKFTYSFYYVTSGFQKQIKVTWNLFKS